MSNNTNSEVIATVNVVRVDKKTFNADIIGSFNDNGLGNIQAEALFISLIEANSDMNFRNMEAIILADELQAIIEDGYFENDTHQYTITHAFNEFGNSGQFI